MVIFKQLWDNHPTIKGEGNPCNSKEFDDQCAMRLGVALRRCGIKVQGVEQCWFHEKSAGHYLRAEELANGLRRSIIPGIQPVRELPGKNFKAHILGTTGIIFFKDYFRRENKLTGKKESFRNRSGDHIDLWNGSRLTNWFSWIRINLGFSIEGRFSDFYDSRSVWFWKVL